VLGETGIEFPSKEKPKQDIDFDRLKSRIENKVVPFLIKNEIEGNQASLYQKFAFEYFEYLAALNKPGMRMVTEKWQRAGLKLHLIFKIKKIINSVLPINSTLKMKDTTKARNLENTKKIKNSFVPFVFSWLNSLISENT